MLSTLLFGRSLPYFAVNGLPEDYTVCWAFSTRIEVSRSAGWSQALVASVR